MQILNFIIEILSIPFLNFIKTTGRLSWVYLLTALIIGFFSILFQNLMRGNFSFKIFFQEAIDFSHWKEKSSLVDYRYYFMETILYSLFFSYFVITTLTFSSFTFQILFFIGGEQRFAHNVLIQFLYTFLFLLGYDFGRFYVHRLFHIYSILWEFHKFHHSAETLNPFTVYRVHPVESILLNSSGAICSGLVNGVFIYFFPTITMFSFLGVNFGLFLFHLYSNLRHSQTWISFPRGLSYILLSPAQHQIHHSKKNEHRDKNLGAIFGFWDYFTDSLYIPKEKEILEFGLPSMEEPKDFTNLFRIFVIPFKKAFDLITRNVPRN